MEKQVYFWIYTTGFNSISSVFHIQKKPLFCFLFFHTAFTSKLKNYRCQKSIENVTSQSLYKEILILENQTKTK